MVLYKSKVILKSNQQYLLNLIIIQELKVKVLFYGCIKAQILTPQNPQLPDLLN